jgi:hypothetical protein
MKFADVSHDVRSVGAAGHRLPVEGDDAVGKAEVQQGEQPGILRRRQVTIERRRLRDLVPVVLDGAVPEAPVNASSGVAAVLPATPSDWTSLTSSLYRSLVSAGGTPGRKVLARRSANGVTFGQCVNCGCLGKFGASLTWVVKAAVKSAHAGTNLVTIMVLLLLVLDCCRCNKPPNRVR